MPKDEKTRTRRKRDDLSSASSADSQTSPEPKRGNVFENYDAAKMADGGGKETTPSLETLWATIMRIDENTKKLVDDHKILQNNYEALQQSLEFTQAKMDELKTCNDTLRAKVNELETKIARTEEQHVVEVNEMQKEQATMENKLQELALQHDELEQYTRKVNLEIYGIPERKDEDLVNVVLDLAERLDVDLLPEDIDITHRLNKKKEKSRPIIIRFANYCSKDQMYRSRLKLRKLNVQSMGAEKIFINENLTARRAALFKRARDKSRSNKGWRVWTMDGKIFIKTSPDSNNAIRIKTIEDLEKL